MPFCPNCGREYPQGAAFCQNCGKPLQVATGVGFSPTAPQASPQPGQATVRRPTGVTILAALQILGSLLMIVVGLAAGIFGLFVSFVGVLTLFFALALLSGRNWARILMMIGAVLDLLSIVGIVWGAILLWYFTRRHVVAYFNAPK